jgi:hypothetical protein
MPSHSLSVNTYPAKARDIGESREIGLERISTAQGVLFVVVVVALAIKGFMTLWLYQPKVAVLIILLLAGTLLSGICMIPQMLPQPGPKMFREGEPVAIERRSKSAATHAVGEHLARRIAPGVCP